LTLIAQAASRNTLKIICGGETCCKDDTTFGIWSFFQCNSFLHQGPLLGTSRRNNYRVELRSISASLYLTQHLQSQINSQPVIMIICQTKRVHHALIHQTPLGIKHATQSNYDVILEARHLISSLNLDVQLHCIPGSLYISNPVPDSIQEWCSTSHPNSLPVTHMISVLHEEHAVHSNLSNLIRNQLHHKPIKGKLHKDDSWKEVTFSSIDWEGYKDAYLSLSHQWQISITKMSHQLWNTNVQNNRYYAETPLCLLCHLHQETADHVYMCTESSALEVRKLQLQT